MSHGAVVALIGTALGIAAWLLSGPVAGGEHLGSHVWTPPFRDAGGYSALWLAPEGPGFVTLSDRGSWIRGTLARDVDGVVSGVTVTSSGALAPEAGRRRAAEKWGRDAESIAEAGGAFFVAYEGRHRIMRFDGLDGVPVPLPVPPDFGSFDNNAGIEALAADASGALYAIPEETGDLRRPFPVFRFADGEWTTPFALPRRGGYLVSGADIGPDGRLYVLEREFAVIGFRTRVRSVELDGGDERTELESHLGQHDNLEGIDVWQDAEGRLRVTMISDDNQMPRFQRTELVDYLLRQDDG
ncbi:esterase-like activity of phytase family protein [uncultured Jannaschia sp.]|uniref:esterase-like activity of phytase family protein n=1 Tax=uncultured Jannaschia sp. TaxID=293347 RepID=UPI002604B77F|nr:esterase-like activity of phytase family protein [uncultured Jannaschia sp.]